MNDAPLNPPFPSSNLLRIQNAYDHWAAISVDAFNRLGEVKPFLMGINFTGDGSFECTLIDPVYVNSALRSSSGMLEMRRFIEELLNGSAMREDMKDKGFRPADIAVFVTEILMTPLQPSLEAAREGILVVMHTPQGVYRGMCPISPAPARHAVVGPMTLDPVQPRPTTNATAAAKLIAPLDPVAYRAQHDLYPMAEKIQ